MKDTSLVGRVAIITGGGRGLGRAFALDLARRGAAVVVNGRPPDQGGVGGVSETVETILADGGRAIPAYASVETSCGGAAIVDTALNTFGRVDILVNNAGFLRNGVFESLGPADIEAVFRVHLHSIFNVTQPAFAAMRQQRYGRVINVSSTTALIGLPGVSNYSSAKGGVLAVTRALAVEGAGSGITVNCVVPSAIGQMQSGNPIPGFAERFSALRERLWPRMSPSTVAPLVTFLASEACTLTGETYAACAGRYCRVAVMFAEGWVARDADSVTAEDISAHIDEIRDISRSFEPHTLADIYEDIIRRLPAG